MFAAAKPRIACTRLRPTTHRPHSEGTYIVRLSPRNKKRLKVWNNAYLSISFGRVSVLARLSVDTDLDDQTIRMDQTLRTALGLDKIMQGSADKESTPEDESLGQSISIQAANFRGPSFLSTVLKQQYLVCIIHHALPIDMETPIARLKKSSMEAIGIESGDKVWLISDFGCQAIRCLPFDDQVRLPLDSMKIQFPPPLPDEEYEGLVLPWVTMDFQTRLHLNQTGEASNDVKPWHPILVGRHLPHALASELSTVAMGLALTALGGAVVLPDTITTDFPWLPVSILVASFVTVLILIALKIRSRI